MRPRWLASLLLLASARGDARTCAPLPLSEQFRWFHVPKTGSSFSVTLWSWLCPTSLPAGFGTKLYQGAVWPINPASGKTITRCVEPAGATDAEARNVVLGRPLGFGHTPMYEAGAPPGAYSSNASANLPPELLALV